MHPACLHRKHAFDLVALPFQIPGLHPCDLHFRRSAGQQDPINLNAFLSDERHRRTEHCSGNEQDERSLLYTNRCDMVESLALAYTQQQASTGKHEQAAGLR